jgi:putative ABC transport system permease protein
MESLRESACGRRIIARLLPLPCYASGVNAIFKLLPLIWSGITRNAGRTALCFLQITVAFCLFGVLQGMRTGAQQAIAHSRADLLDVRPAVYGSGSLPVAYLDRIRSLPGVKIAQLLNGFSGTYQNPTQHVYALALDPDEQWLSMAPEIFKISPKDLRALAQNRAGALVSRALLAKYHWKLGSRIPLVSADTLQETGSPDWTFNVVGTYALHELAGSDTDLIVINNRYLDEARAADKGTAVHFLALASTPLQANAVADEIDRQFANSAHATRTESYRDGAEQEMRSIGDLDFVIRAVVGAVLAALLLSTATMMMQSIRERTPELATLKAVGYSDGRVFALVVAESLVIFLGAAALGLGIATLAFPFASRVVPGLSMPSIVVAVGFAGAAALALISAFVPAIWAARLEVASALGRL